MKTLIAVSATALLGTAAAMAQAPEFAEVDADANGEVTLAELQEFAPDATQDDIDSYDIDDSGTLSDNEFVAWSVSYDVDAEAESDVDEPMAPQNR